MITVVNQRTHKKTPMDYYIGRPSHLGNRFSSKPSIYADVRKTETPEEAVALYKSWLWMQVNWRTPEVIKALKAIPQDANLVCWCAPKTCHGDVIKELLETNMLTITCSEGDCFGRGIWTEDGGKQITCFACNGTGSLTVRLNETE